MLPSRSATRNSASEGARQSPLLAHRKGFTLHKGQAMKLKRYLGCNNRRGWPLIWSSCNCSYRVNPSQPPFVLSLPIWRTERQQGETLTYWWRQPTWKTSIASGNSQHLGGSRCPQLWHTRSQCWEWWTPAAWIHTHSIPAVDKSSLIPGKVLHFMWEVRGDAVASMRFHGGWIAHQQGNGVGLESYRLWILSSENKNL